MGKQIPLPGSADFQFTQQAVGNTSQLFGTEWIKDDDFIQAAHQFGPEIILGFLYRLFAAAGALGLRSGKTQRGCLPDRQRAPRLEVSRIMVLEKSARRPWASVKEPPSKICSNRF